MQCDTANKLFRPWDSDVCKGLRRTQSVTLPSNLSSTMSASAIECNSFYQSLLLSNCHHQVALPHLCGVRSQLSLSSPFLLNSQIASLQTSFNRFSLAPTANLFSPSDDIEASKKAGKKLKRQRPKRFNCPHCQTAFSNNGQLKGHVRTHTGERPFICEHENCGKTFTRNEELTRHRRIHTGIRPFICSICSKSFGRKDHLKKHSRTHERRYISFATTSDLAAKAVNFPNMHSTNNSRLALFNSMFFQMNQ